MFDLWELWKKGFDAWEGVTAKYVEQVLRSPMVLEPAGAMLTATMKTSAALHRTREAMWSTLGLATRTDQERTLHALQQIQSRLMDLEEDLRDARRERV